MIEVEKVKINGGSVVLVQGLICSFGIFYIAFICYFFIGKKIETDAIFFLAILLTATILMMWYSLSNSDIYMSGENVILEKIFTKKIIPISQIESINKSFFPFLYYLKFRDGKKVCFQLKIQDIFSSFINSKSTLDILTAKINQQ